ncbi:MAG: hypothetical protein INR69_08375 [Mucilaginibacter polytrichastri]|nr:hypothetical protein [Mucilaginibacter polytrichastri]
MDHNEELIEFTQLKSKFKEELNDLENRQILFSGPFGNGKTTFLKEFFKQEDYAVFHVYPVNYSLHSNQDIFEILKYDIILELIAKGAFYEIDISNLHAYLYSISKNVDEAFGKLLSKFSQTGKSLKTLVDTGGSFFSKIKTTKQELQDPFALLRELENSVGSKTPYLNEDFVSTLIVEKLSKLERKEKILIVDDLDRIDPEHLFRIISVFSAYIDQESGRNKFDFDRIIFVGDVRNFEAIFAHRYGLVNNFNAFISKLVSKRIFDFDPDKEIYVGINTYLNSINFIVSEGNYSIGSGSNNRFYIYLRNFLVSNFVYKGVISLREIRRSENINLFLSGKYIKYNNKDISLAEYEIYQLFVFLRNFFQSNQQLITSIKGLVGSTIPISKSMKNRDIKYENILSDISSIPLELLAPEPAVDDRAEQIDNNFYNIEYLSTSNGRGKLAHLSRSGINQDMVLELVISAFSRILYYL